MDRGQARPVGFSAFPGRNGDPTRTRQSWQFDTAPLAQEILDSTRNGSSGAAVKERVEPLLRRALRETGIDVSFAGGETTTVLNSKRADAVTRAAVIEYAPPGSLGNASEQADATQRVHHRLQEEARRSGNGREELLERMVGIALDGEQVLFSRYRRSAMFLPTPVPLPPASLNQVRAAQGYFLDQGPYPLAADSLACVLIFVRSAARRRLTAQDLARELGPKQHAARLLVSELYKAAEPVARANAEPGAPALFEEWDRLFGVVYGEAMQPAPSATETAASYGLDPGARWKPLLFALQTYYALLTKFIAVELVAARGRFPVTPHVSGLDAVDDLDLRARLTGLERGDDFGSFGVLNFVEPNLFAWYLDSWSPPLARALRGVLRALGEFEPSTPILDPDSARDLLQQLYAQIVPRSLRHALGEYYTPDWLASQVLDKAGYDGGPGRRLLDPACGSGTFLVQAINRAIRYAECQANPDLAAVARDILRGIVGFDLNPLAVLAARTNYLIAYSRLLPYVRPLSIPVFRRDTVVPVSPEEVPVAPAALREEPFDYVVGNPPWIRWGYLPAEYRQRTLPLWQQYGLFSLRGHEARLGQGEKDYSMLFTYVCADRYLKAGGILGFVITEEVFKSKGAGEGFRRFRLGQTGDHLQVLGVEDLVSLKPFHAENKTTVFTLTKGEPTRYPVPVVEWTRKPGTGRIPLDWSLQQVRENTIRRLLQAVPVDPDRPNSSWQTAPRSDLRIFAKLKGPNPYQACRGASTDPYGVFRLRLKETRPDSVLIVENLPDLGKTEIERVEAPVESGLVYPAAGGAELVKFGSSGLFYVLVAQDPKTRRGVTEDVLKAGYPLTFAYLQRFERVLSRRAAYLKYFHKPVREPDGTVRQVPTAPFWTMYNISTEALAPWRVAWKRMASRMAAAVLSDAPTPFGRKTVIATDTTSFIAVQSLREAHYLCAILNSDLVDTFIRSFSSKGRGFGAPSVMRYLAIPRFDPANELASVLAACSEEAHRRVASGRPVGDVQEKIDAGVRRLWKAPDGA